MKQKILTVIVPTYNMENYLRKDLDSLIISEGLENVEVIVVNDGSRDKSLDIATEYAEKYPYVFRIIDKPNGNYGSCINAALRIASGKYIKIMDADDSFDTDNFETLVAELAAIDVDIVFTDYIKTYINGKIISYSFDLPIRKKSRIEDVYKTSAFYNILLPALTYRTNMLREMGYRQTEGVSYSDLEWCFSPVTEAKTVYYSNICVYKYLLGREGQTMDPAVYSKSIPQRIICFSSMLKSIAGKSLSDYMIHFTTEQLVKHAFYIYEYFLIKNPSADRALLYEFDGEFKQYNLKAYERCDKFMYRLHIPYPYVTKWRCNNIKQIPWLVRVCGKLLDVIGSIHVKMMRSNPNEER